MERPDANETWQVLALAMDEIYNRNASQLSFEELYRSSYHLVLHKHGDLLYEGVSDKITSHLVTAVEKLAETQEENLLEAVSKAWNDHKVTMAMIRDILMYMDRVYITQSKRRPVYELGLHLFRVTVWEHPAVRGRVIELLLQAISQERAGMVADDRNLFKSIIGMLLEVGNSLSHHHTPSAAIYHNDFEAPFLATTQEFYNLESLEYLSSATASDYVRKATSRLAEEQERAQSLQLPVTTEGPLMHVVQTEWIERHAITLVDMETTGFSALLQADDDKRKDMQEMYDLFSRIPQSVDHLRDALANRVKADGEKCMADQSSGQADAATFLRHVLAMRAKYTGIVEESFRNEKKAQKRMRESFEDFLNADARAASCLAVYVDELLRVGLRGATDDEIKTTLEKTITIFRYLNDKDVFESYYKQHLAKRLLGGRSVGDEAERRMVSLLKAECGYQYTSKLEGMFNDMRISKETRDKYKTYKRQKDGSCSVDIEVDVLTTGYWPSQKAPQCTLPETIQSSIEHFSKFYLGEHTGRKLSWQTTAGAAELRANFGGRRHDLLVSTYQMCILLLFNEEDVLTLGQIRTRTQIPDSELRRHLISLCTPKNKILKKGSKGRGINSDDDTFTYNLEYTSKLKRVRIPLVKEASIRPSGGAAGEATTAAGANTAEAAVPAVVEEDRRHLVEAAVVRVMKARRRLDHNDLIAEVTRQVGTRFNPTPQFIKRRIEALIERDYLERAENEHRIYLYVA